jgi:hypothetical protein
MTNDDTEMFFALLFLTYTQKINHKNVLKKMVMLTWRKKMPMVMVPQKHSLFCCSMLTCAQIRQTKRRFRKRRWHWSPEERKKDVNGNTRVFLALLLYDCTHKQRQIKRRSKKINTHNDWTLLLCAYTRTIQTKRRFKRRNMTKIDQKNT